MLIALTREVSPLIRNCELAFQSRAPIDFAKAQRQHRQYEECLAGLGCNVRQIPAALDCSDSVFVEDTCIVFDELAVITRPGAASRRAETAGVADVVKDYRSLRFILEPATLDGGDVLRLGRQIFVGHSTRTNVAGIEQLKTILSDKGYEVVALPLTSCLHLKSAVTMVAPHTILVNRQWVDPSHFGCVEVIEVDPAEPCAANALLIGDTVVYPTAHPATLKRLESHGIRVAAIDMGELIKAESGVTCCSVLFESSSSGAMKTYSEM